MQAKVKFNRKRQQWVVDTRATGIKKLNGSKGEYRAFPAGLQGEQEAHSYAAIVNAQQESGGVITRAASGTIAAAVELYCDNVDRRFAEGKIVAKHVQCVKKNALDWCTLDFGDTLFGQVKCIDVNVDQVRELTDQLRVDVLKDKVLVDRRVPSVKTKREKLRALKMVFDIAIEKQWALINPARKVRIEAVKYQGAAAAEEKASGLEKISAEDIAEIIAVALDLTPIIGNAQWCDGLAVWFDVYTGLRFGEQAALIWSDLDMETGRRVSVVRAQRDGGCGVLVTDIPKTTSTGAIHKQGRKIPLSPSLIAALKEWRARSPLSGDNDLVFPTQSLEAHKDSSALRKFLHRVLDEVGRKHFRWHDLRHLYASIQIDLNGDNWNLLADRLGHQDVKTTRDHYVHWIEDQKRDDDDAERQDAYMEAASQRRLARAA